MIYVWSAGKSSSKFKTGSCLILSQKTHSQVRAASTSEYFHMLVCIFEKPKVDVQTYLISGVLNFMVFVKLQNCKNLFIAKFNT